MEIYASNIQETSYLGKEILKYHKDKKFHFDSHCCPPLPVFFLKILVTQINTDVNDGF